ncbi:MAG: hypothetical protein NC086_11500 [Alistipes sp.]|nr:hypothetical protein [Alistipes sp.]
MKLVIERLKTIGYLVILWAFVHLYKLNSIPAGLNIDEAGMAYDAFCLLNWGVDRYLNPYPLYFYNLGGV